MLYFTISTPDEYYPEMASIESVSTDPSRIINTLVFEANSDYIKILYTEDLSKYEIYTGSYGILKYKSKHKNITKVWGENKINTIEQLSTYLDEELINDVAEAKYYIKKDGKIISEDDILSNLKNLINE